VLATYETSPEGVVGQGSSCYAAYYYLDLKEWYIYGSESDGRISVLKPYTNEFNNIHLVANHIPQQALAEPLAMKDTIIYYGFDNIGTYQTNARYTGHKEYEIKDHLGNVRAVISDVKNPESMVSSISSWTFTAEIRNLNNYYPYGMELPGGAYASIGNYGYGYNGMEKDDELKGSGKLYSTLFREGDTENGRWWSRDPMEMSMPYQSPYILMDANPIKLTDKLGNSTKIKKEETEDKDGNKIEKYSFKFKAAILNSSDVPIDMNKFSSALMTQLLEAFNGSEIVYNRKTNRYETVIWEATSIDITIIDDKNELKSDEHLIEISHDFTENVRGMAWGTGLQIYINPGSAIEQISGENIRTMAHEWGHTLNMYHPEEYTIWGDVPPNQNIPNKNVYPDNLMRMTESWLTIQEEQGIKGNGNALNANQIRIMYKSYKEGILNKDDRNRPWYEDALWKLKKWINLRD